MFQTELVKSRQFRRYKDTPFVGNCAGNTSHFLFRWRKLSFFFLFNEREGKYGCCTKWRGRFICIGKSSLHFLDVMKHELNSGMFCLCPCKMLQSALTLVRVQACSVWLPWSLFLMEVSIHVVLCTCYQEMSGAQRSVFDISIKQNECSGCRASASIAWSNTLLAVNGRGWGLQSCGETEVFCECLL